MKPLFIPLKREFFEAFKKGYKRIEYRKYGQRWNERTCYVGRPVTLSLGYGKKHRLAGVVAGFNTNDLIPKIESWRKCYGDDPGPAACIHIEIKK